MGPGFISATILAINNLRDIKSDREANKRTIAVRFGEVFQRRLCVILIAGSSFILIIAASTYHYFYLNILALLPLFFIKNWLHIFSQPIDQRMNQALAKTAQYLLLYCLLVSLVLIISPGFKL